MGEVSYVGYEIGFDGRSVAIDRPIVYTNFHINHSNNNKTNCNI